MHTRDKAPAPQKSRSNRQFAKNSPTVEVASKDSIRCNSEAPVGVGGDCHTECESMNDKDVCDVKEKRNPAVDI
jgi:hypothetical protein